MRKQAYSSRMCSSSRGREVARKSPLRKPIRETADTLAAQREMKTLGSKTVAICNVVDAMVAREAHGAIYTHAGPEIGVASTKAFTSQLTALFLLALKLGQ